MQKLLLVYYYSENHATSEIWKVLPNMIFPPIWGEKWRRSEHAHAGYPGLSFRPPGFSPYRGAGRKESSGTGLLCRWVRMTYKNNFLPTPECSYTRLCNHAKKTTMAEPLWISLRSLIPQYCIAHPYCA